MKSFHIKGHQGQMARHFLAVFALGAALSTLTACSGGNPFTPPTTPDETPITVPQDIAGDLDSISYNPVTQTLTVTGLTLDDTPVASTYRRRPNLDVPGYQAYTQQTGSLDRHVTAYVSERDGVVAGVVATGGQFQSYFAGGTYSRTGSFDPAGNGRTGGVVSYAGEYVGLLNTSGDGGDLLPVAPGTPNDVRPRQTAEVTGRIFINADFTDNSINGRIFERRIPDRNANIENIDLRPGAIATDGSFSGTVDQGNSSVGSYAGVFGGPNSSAVGGALRANGHIGLNSDLIENGAFVLAQCGTPGASPICDQPVP